jgi:hypothetical protein
LSTVGFGDFHPISSAERLVCAFVLLFGVAIFSYIMGIFISILDQYSKSHADFDEGHKLNRFFGLLIKFNLNAPTNLDMKLKFEKYFDYKWKNDKNIAIGPEEKAAIVDQLPIEIQDRLFNEFLYNDFIKRFWKFFRYTTKAIKDNDERVLDVL